MPRDRSTTLVQAVTATFVASLLIALVAVGATARTARGAAAGPVPVPSNGKLYWGAWTDEHRVGDQPPWDMAAIGEIERHVRKGMSLLPFATPFADRSGREYFEFPTREFDKVRAHGSIPFFSWSTHAMRNYGHRRFSLRAVISGVHDAYIRRWARTARAWGHPFFLRFNWEMNDDTFPWTERYGSNRRGEYVAAWRHVRRIFDRVGARNAAWVWCPMVDPYRTERPLPDLYPGSRYVDWTCLDAYNTFPEWKSFASLIEPMYRQITRQIAPGKPMVIGETASTEGRGDKARWIGDMFGSIRRRFPAIRGLVYFDKDDVGPGGGRRLPLDSSRRATDAFARAIAPRSVYSNRLHSLRVVDRRRRR